MLFLNQYVINFTGLKEGEHNFEFDLDNKFFEHFDYNDFNSCQIKAGVRVNKKSNLLELVFSSKGRININCFVSNEPFDYLQEHQIKLVVKFSSELINDNEELVILPVGTSTLNVAQYLFEMIILSLPIKIIHPGVVDGSLESETLNKLKELESKAQEKSSKIDPRWDKLKDLI
ncbi:MAG: DUF177 domain-containing protein [Flavobacteriaceae bacterium]|jgi:uncharacterized metal-binding protein YceD (DUF177 family)|tara:strand:+ start:918 stop:1439 length:522 start_codon:yes stop_codon:yes gene_type:complete